MSETFDAEVLAIKAVNDALAPLDDPAAIQRVLSWAISRFGSPGVIATTAQSTPQQVGAPPATDRGDAGANSFDIAEVAEMDDTGRFRLVVSDIKASSINDAAVRLAYVSILAYERLTGSKSVSSPDVIVPILKEWGVYTSNTRNAIAAQQAILRTGDRLSLATPGRRQAEQYIADVLNPNVKGTWAFGAKRKTRKRSSAEGKQEG